MSTVKEQEYFEKLDKHLTTLMSGQNSSVEVMRGFPKYTPRQTLTRFLVFHELFKKILDVKGSIIECGVFRGAGLMTWAQLSAIYEPVNYHREIIGFDTFSGFPSVVEKDKGSKENINTKPGGIAADSYEELKKVIELYNANRFLSHVDKVQLVKGDFMTTAPEFIKKNQHTLVSLLYLDFDLYEPTKEALRVFLPRMPKGAVVAFDEVGQSDWPGETLALLEELNLNKYKLQQFHFEPNISYIVL